MYTLSSVESNKTRMMELTESLRLVYVNATKEMGAEVSALMKELRKAQSAVKKSLDRKQDELDRMKPLTVAVPEMLSERELQDMVHEIKEEPNEFEPLLHQ